MMAELLFFRTRPSSRKHRVRGGFFLHNSIRARSEECREEYFNFSVFVADNRFSGKR